MEVSLYNEVGKLSVNIAEQIMALELEGKHEAFVAKKVDELRKTDLN